MTVVTDPRKTGIHPMLYAGTFALASLPSPVTYSGYQAFASDLGANGTVVISNGTRWRPMNGSTVLKDLGAPTGAIANTETIVLQSQLPINAWQANDTVRIWLAVSKSGGTDAGQMSIRIGTLGTVGDTLISGYSSLSFMGATALTGGYIFDVKLISATSAMKVGNGSGSASGYGNQSTTAPVGATTITDASANALFINVTVKSAGATDTLSIQSGQLELHTA